MTGRPADLRGGFLLFSLLPPRSGDDIRQPGAYLSTMTQIKASLIAIMLLATPAAAQEEDSSPLFPDMDTLRGYGDMAGDLLSQFVEDLRPMVERLSALIDDVSAYEAPEMLPNGDIIIRRKEDAPPPPDETDPAPYGDEEGISL